MFQNSLIYPATEHGAEMPSEESVHNLASSAKSSSAQVSTPSSPAPNQQTTSHQLMPVPGSTNQQQPAQPNHQKGLVAAMTRLYKSSKNRRVVQFGVETDDPSGLAKVKGVFDIFCNMCGIFYCQNSLLDQSSCYFLMTLDLNDQ